MVSELTGWDRRLSVTAGGKGLVGHAGAVLLRKVADRVGLTGGLAEVLPAGAGHSWRERAHVVVQHAVAIVLEAANLTEAEQLQAHHRRLFGPPVSDSTTRRTLMDLDGEVMAALSRARAKVRRHVWSLLARALGQGPLSTLPTSPVASVASSTGPDSAASVSTTFDIRPPPCSWNRASTSWCSRSFWATPTSASPPASMPTYDSDSSGTPSTPWATPSAARTATLTTRPLRSSPAVTPPFQSQRQRPGCPFLRQSGKGHPASLFDSTYGRASFRPGTARLLQVRLNR